MRTFVRVLLSLVCAFFMIGFGLCGAAGVAFTWESPEPLLIVLTLLGLALAGACGFAIYRIWKPRQ